MDFYFAYVASQFLRRQLNASRCPLNNTKFKAQSLGEIVWKYYETYLNLILEGMFEPFEIQDWGLPWWHSG